MLERPAATTAILLYVASCSPGPPVRLAPTPPPVPTHPADAAIDVNVDAAPAPPPEGPFIGKLRAGSVSQADLVRECKDSSVAEILRVLPSLSGAAKLTAVLCLGRLPGAGPALLALTKVSDAMVRAFAANALGRISDPALADELLRTIPETEDPHVRGCLYLALGSSLSPARIEELRTLARAEKAPLSPRIVSMPSNSALVALVKLGGKAERAAFVAEVGRTQDHDDIRWIAQTLVDYLKDPSLARPLGAWLTNEEFADPSHVPTFRVCDLAAWTSKELGINVPIDPAGIRKYDRQTLRRVRVILNALPER